MREDKRKIPKSTHQSIVRMPSHQDAAPAKVKATRMVRIINNSKQMIPLQMRPPGTSFYRNEQQIRLNPGKHAMLPYDHLRADQIENLQKKGFIKIIYDSGSKNSKQN
jgi:hypothetical protein